MQPRAWTPERRMLALEECHRYLQLRDGTSDAIVAEEMDWLESLDDVQLIRERNRMCYGW